jgi:anti-sigma factor ChrR (cupin superfamily)
MTLSDALTVLTPEAAGATRFVVVAWPDADHPVVVSTLAWPGRDWYATFRALFQTLLAQHDPAAVRQIGTHMILALTDTVTPPVVRL